MDFSVTQAQEMSSRDGSLDVHFNAYDAYSKRYRPLQIECIDSTSHKSQPKLPRRHSPIVYSTPTDSSDRSRARSTEKRYTP